MSIKWTPPKIRTFGSFNPAEVSRETHIENDGKNPAQQHFKDECDINTIASRFLAGQIELQPVDPSFVDYSDVPDFQTMLNKLRQGEAAFAALPADIRGRFDHDPGQFMDFVHDPANVDELVKMGILTKRESPPAGEGAPLDASMAQT